MAKQPGIKIKPRMNDPARTKPSKIEILDGMRDLPEFVELDDRHWASIYAMWDFCATHGKPAPRAFMAEAAGVAESTIAQWRCREDYLRASELVQLQVLHEWRPVLLHAGLKKATTGNTQLLKLFLERILPEKTEETDAPDTEINISWGENVIDVEPNDGSE